MIICSVEIKKFLIGQIRNIIRVTTGLTAIGDIREQRIHNISFKHIVRRRKCALHLIINDTIIGQRAFRFFQMIAPSFLTEDLFFLINVRIEYSIQINMHQVLEILIVAAGNRIAGFVRISHRIQKGIQRALDQFYKWIF